MLTYLIGFHSSKNQIRKFWTRYKKINFLPFFFKLHSHLFFLNDSFFPASLCPITFMLHVRAYINVKDRVRVNKRAYRNSRVRRTRMRVNRQCTLMFSRVLYFSGLLKRRTFNISLLFSYFAYLLCTVDDCFMKYSSMDINTILLRQGGNNPLIDSSARSIFYEMQNLVN